MTSVGFENSGLSFQMVPLPGSLSRKLLSIQSARAVGICSVRSIAVPTSNLTRKHDPLPLVEKCPSPTCQCAGMPRDLDIDYKKTLRGTMPRYTKHVVIRTGRDDWASRIEDENLGPDENGKDVNLARELKALIGPKGKYFNVCINSFLCCPLPSYTTIVNKTIDRPTPSPRRIS